MQPREARALIALAASMFTVTMGVGFIVPLLAVYADTLGAGGLWIGLIFGADPAMRAAVIPFIGYLSDRRGRKRLLLIGLAGHALVAVLMALCMFPWQLLLLRILQGGFSAMVMPVSRAYAGALAPRHREGSIMGLFNLAFMLGFSMGPLLGGVVTDLFGLRMPFILMGGLSVVALAVARVFIPEQQTTSAQPVPGIGAAIRAPVVRGICIARAFNSMSLGLVLSLLPLYGSAYLGLSGSALGIAIFSFTLFASGLQPVFGALADRVNRKRMVAIGFVLTPLALALIPRATDFSSLMLLSVFIGLGPGVFIPASLAITVVEGHKYGMGSTMGLVEMSLSLGMAMGSLLAGVVAETFGMITAFYVVALVSLLGLPILLWSLRGHGDDEQESERSPGNVTG